MKPSHTPARALGIRTLGTASRCMTKRPAHRKAASLEAACPVLLPLLDELRTYLYEHQIEEIPASLAV